ncbi:extracellular solute-binding protein [Rhodoferax sp. WC2427]|uniref:extracellular solute-binding protein n=1 Tax=Rhodoferax sp. WC2427 TaxID=3234144 RepID=UPI00346754A5
MKKTLHLTPLLLSALGATAMAAPIDIPLWRHESGDLEVTVTRAMIDDFNKSQPKYKVVYENLPKGSYTQSVTAAAVAKKLPCLIDMDQPTVANFAWSGYVRPLDKLLDKDLQADLLEGGKGTYKGVLYSVGQYDVALALYGRKSALAKAGVRVATIAQPWSLAETNDAFAKLKKLPEFEYVIDIHNSYDGEWWTYGFSPWLQSFGGDLIDRKSMTTAEGALNGKPAVAFGGWFQDLFKKGFVNKKPADDKSFVQGRVPLDFIGSWGHDEIFKKWGDDAVVMPVPDFGKGPKIGAASWQYGISASCPNPEGAAAFIDFMLQPANVAKLAQATSLLPATKRAAALTTDYREGGKLRFYYDFAQKYALTRPSTPGYPFLTSTFEKALRDIATGANVQTTLDNAADAIDRNIADNKGYGFKR